MVVDEDPKTKERTRRFLAYDLMAVNAQNVTLMPWCRRWDSIDRLIQVPRRMEGDAIAKGTWALRYDYAGEAFRFRRKDFWPLAAANKLIHEFIPRQVSHEADGLIFQPYDEFYKPLTCESLLKWKFAHLNSVDFKLKVTAPSDRTGSNGDSSKEPPLRLTLQLLHPPAKGVGAPTISDLPDARVVFPDGINPRSYDGRIIECSWDPAQEAWSFMRDRRDKTVPNAHYVYEKVVMSIKDDIKEDELLRVIAG
jgi:mRNA-capping enzyme